MQKLLIANESQRSRLMQFSLELHALCMKYQVALEGEMNGGIDLLLIDDTRPESIHDGWPAMAEYLFDERGCEFYEYDESALPNLLAAGIVGKV